MLDIVKVQNILFPLRPGESFLKEKRQIYQRTDRFPAHCHLLHDFLRRSGKIVFLHRLQVFFDLRADGFDQFPLHRRNSLILFRGKSAESKVQKAQIARFIALRCEQALELFFFLFEQFPIHIRAIRHFAQSGALTNPVYHPLQQ